MRVLAALRHARAHALVMTVSSMMPPFSLVNTLRVPVPLSSAAMSPTTRVSKKEMASLPCSVRPHMCETSKREALLRHHLDESMIESLYCIGIDHPAKGTILPGGRWCGRALVAL